MTPSSSAIPRTSESRGGLATPLVLGGLLALLPALAAAGEGKEKPPEERIKVTRVWASDAAPEEKGAGKEKDDLKDVRRLLEEQTKKKSFAVEGKVVVEPSVPGKANVVPLIEEFKLEILRLASKGGGKDKEEARDFQLRLLQADQEKRKIPVEWKAGRSAIVYITPIRRNNRDLVVIIQTLGKGKS